MVVGDFNIASLMILNLVTHETKTIMNIVAYIGVLVTKKKKKLGVYGDWVMNTKFN